MKEIMIKEMILINYELNYPSYCQMIFAIVMVINTGSIVIMSMKMIEKEYYFFNYYLLIDFSYCFKINIKFIHFCSNISLYLNC